MKTKGARNWTQAELDTVSEMMEQGRSNYDIAVHFGRTPQAVANIKMRINDPDYYRKFHRAPIMGATMPELAGWAIAVMMGFSAFLIFLANI
ncbi:MAG: hypothetical protein P8P29_08685 [Flavobacteriaceae bacterium]|nr:hypothetical protein [Flavobacteriaceae bacterium]